MSRRPISMRIIAKLALSLACLFVCAGCTLRSRWALDDPGYARKYGQDPPDAPPARKLKRALDGRWLGGNSGVAAGLGFKPRSEAGRNAAAGAEIEVFNYFTPCLEAHAGLTGLAGTDAGDLFGGAHLGARLQAPARIAPFVGMGALGAWSKGQVPVEDDGQDNDDDMFIDEKGEEEETVDNAYAAIFPEVGVHVWSTSRLRVTALARYHISTDGRDADNWYFGVNIGFRESSEGFDEEFSYAFKKYVPPNIPLDVSELPTPADPLPHNPAAEPEPLSILPSLELPLSLEVTPHDGAIVFVPPPALLVEDDPKAKEQEQKKTQQTKLEPLPTDYEILQQKK